MSMLELLSRPECWEAFYEYKTGLACPKTFAKELRGFIDRAGFLRVTEDISAGRPFPLPKKAVVSKMSSQKKRTVYTYPAEENTVLKLLTWLLVRRYDGAFCGNLYSFRPGRTAKDAVRRLTAVPGIRQMYAYKADVSDYFNSIPVERLLPLLEAATADDPALFAFLRGLLTEPFVLDRGVRVEERKGIMAGTPLSAFYANLYLAELDRHFADAGIPYARYSDDIILFAESREAAQAQAAFVRSFLAARGLGLNPEKEAFYAPEDGWVFLGFRYRDGVVDLAPASLKKLKAKMRRKTDALRRWQRRNGLDGEKAAVAFIRVFNRKLFENPADNELTWARWFFPVLTPAYSLRELDRYAQDCVRYLLTGTRTKARYNARYADLKKLGYRSLVHAYYEAKKAEDAR